MKQRLLITFLLLFTVNLISAQTWMTNLEIAQRLALVQNKMVLMVWEESTSYEYPVLVKDERGRTIFVNNLYDDEYISPLIWQHFVPVIVSEDRYADLYEKIKGKRSQKYIDKFNDDTIKIMDVNGNIVNTDYLVEDLQNVTTIIQRYAFDTSFMAEEINNYRTKKDFYSAYYLASKYLDFSLYVDRKVRANIIDLANIYLDEAKVLVVGEDMKERDALRQRCELLKAQEFLLRRRPKKVIRALKGLKEEDIAESNKSFVAFLYYTAYMCMDKLKDAKAWKSELSSLNLKKAQQIITINN